MTPKAGSIVQPCGATLSIGQPGQVPFRHRYHLPWSLQLAPLWEATYNHLSAEADDPSLALTEFLGGTSDWRHAPEPRQS